MIWQAFVDKLALLVILGPFFSTLAAARASRAQSARSLRAAMTGCAQSCPLQAIQGCVPELQKAGDRAAVLDWHYFPRGALCRAFLPDSQRALLEWERPRKPVAGALRQWVARRSPQFSRQPVSQPAADTEAATRLTPRPVPGPQPNPPLVQPSLPSSGGSAARSPAGRRARRSPAGCCSASTSRGPPPPSLPNGPPVRLAAAAAAAEAAPEQPRGPPRHPEQPVLILHPQRTGGAGPGAAGGLTVWLALSVVQMAAGSPRAHPRCSPQVSEDAPSSSCFTLGDLWWVEAAWWPCAAWLAQASLHAARAASPLTPRQLCSAAGRRTTSGVRMARRSRCASA